MNKKDVLKIMETIASDPFFHEYKVRRSDNAIVLKDIVGYKQIVPHYYNTVDLSRNCELALEIRPFYEIRFNILHKWFEKYSKKTIKDQRDKNSLMFWGEKINKTNEFFFLENHIDYDKDIILLRKQIVDNAKKLFSHFTNLNRYYDYCIGNVLKGMQELPDVGFDWVIEYLIATKLVAPSNYEYVKKLILQRVDYMMSRNEPNTAFYYDDLPMILDDLEGTDFASGAWGQLP